MLNKTSSCSLAYYPHIAGLTQEEEITSFHYHTEKRKKKFFMIFSDLVSCLKDFSHPDVIYISSGIIFHWEIFSKKKEKGKSNLTQGQISRIELSEKSSFSVVKKDVETALRLLVSTASEYVPGSHGRSLLTVLTPSLKKPCECIPCVTPIRKLDHLEQHWHSLTEMV